MRAIASFMRYAARLLCWYENPFVLREVYLARRRRRGIWLGLAVESALVGLTLFLVALGARAYLMHEPGAGIGIAWGGSLGALCAMPVTLIHCFFVWRAAGSRSGDWISKEVAQGTLQTLLVTPMTPTEMVLKRAAWPFVNAMLAAVVGLPFYMICASMGGLDFWTIVSLYVVFAAVAAAESGPGTGRGAAANLLRGASLLGVAFVIVSIYAVSKRFMTPANPIGIVLLAAQFLVGWQPFFSFHLPPLAPLLLLSPLWLSTAALSWSWRVYDDERILVHIGRCRSALLMLLALVLLGYLWPHLVGVGSGWAADLLGGGGMGAALRGTLLILLAIAVLVTGWETLQARYATLGADVLCGRQPDPDQGARRQLYLSLMGALSATAPPVVLYCLGSLSAGENPLQVGPEFLGLALGASLAAVLYTFGLGVVIWASLSGRRAAQGTVAALLFTVLVALPLAARLLPVPAEAGEWMTTFSPLGGLSALAGSATWAVHGPIWRIVLLQAAVGAAFGLGGLAIWERRIAAYERRARAAAVGRPDEAKPRARRWFMGLWAKIVGRVQERWDNPIFVREVRLGSRRFAWPGGVVLVAFAFAALLGIAVRYPRELQAAATSIPYMGYVGRLPPLAGAFAAIPPLVLTVVVAVSLFLCATSAAAHLARERRRGTLAFTLTTPLSPTEIITGSAAAAMAPAGVIIIATAVPCLALTIISFAAGGWLLAVTLILWAISLAVAGTGVALGVAGLYQFKQAAESSASLTALIVIGIVELLRVLLTIILYRSVGAGLLTYAPIWVSFGIEALIGVAGYAIAVDRLRGIQFGDLPIEREWLQQQ